MLPGITTLEKNNTTGKVMVARIANPTVLLDLNTVDYNALPEGYTKLEYLEEGSSGGCMIDTGVAGSDKLIIEGKIYYSKWVKYATLAFGNYVDEASNVWRIIFNSADNNTFLPYANSQAGAAKYTMNGGKKVIGIHLKSGAKAVLSSVLGMDKIIVVELQTRRIIQQISHCSLPE